MRYEHDYDESVMAETVPPIHVPALLPPASSAMSSARGSASLFNELERLMSEEREREERRLQGLKGRQQHIGEQVGRRLAEKERKIRELEEEQRRKLYSECTFKPKTGAKGEKRSLNEFLQQQSEFTRKVAEKRNTIKQSLEAEKNTATFHPKTNPRARQDKPQESTVFDRLYALKDKENDLNNAQDLQEDTHHPKITQKSKKLARNAPIDHLLYTDALRRQEKARDIESASLGPQARPERTVNLNNEKYVAQKFIKEYFGVIERLGVPTTSGSSMDYMLFNEVLKEMGFAGVEEESENSHERALIHEAYQILQKYTVNARNTCVFLLALIGIYNINPVNFHSQDEPARPEQELDLTEKEGRKLQKYFDLFKRNRLFGENGRREEKNESEEFAFHPKINKASEEMAEKYRGQMLEEANRLLEQYPELDYNIPEDGVITLTDLLVLNNLAKEIRMQQKKEEGSRKEMEECTFKPTTLPPSATHTLAQSNFSSMEGSLGQKKSLELFNHHRNLQSKKESLRVSRQTDDAAVRECTFAPNIAHPHIPTDTSKFHTKQVEETLYRMRKGREQAELKKKFLERGERPTKEEREREERELREKERERERERQRGSKVVKETREEDRQGEEIPTLLLDVNLGEKMDRITLWPGDEERVEEVAAEFARKHGLDAENEQKLSEMLRLEL